jgi:SAM-dependent methyltransferase
MDVNQKIAASLDAALRDLPDGDLAEICGRLETELLTIRRDVSIPVWRDALPAARQHPVFDLMQQCPFIAHGWSKPRGYPGDAGLIDFLYRHPSAERAGTTPTGLALGEIWTSTRTAEAVRRRRDALGAAIDDVASTRQNPSVFALACGHLREFEHSKAAMGGLLGRFVALDQDEASLAVVTERLSMHRSVETVVGSVLGMLVLDNDLGTFDLAYAAGLYDYLDQPTAVRLTRVLYDMLKPGGLLILPNYLQSCRAAGGMELFMDWWLVYREAANINSLLDEINENEDPIYVNYWEDLNEVGYLSMRKHD